jgi:hypothetical protein
MINPSLSDFVIEVNGKRDFNPTEMGGEANLVYRWLQDSKIHGSWGVLPGKKEKT